MFWVLSAIGLALLIFGESRYRKSGHAIAAAPKPIQAIPVRPSTFPVIAFDNITPVGQAITSAQAVKLFRLWMLATGYLDKQELPDWARSFSEDMKSHGESLVYDVLHEKQQLKAGEALECTLEIRALKRRLEKIKTASKRAEIEAEIAECEAAYFEEAKYLRKAEVALKEFRADKRQFTVDYINNITQPKPNQ